MEETLTVEYQGFVIDDDKKAEWAILKLREAETDKQKWADYYTDQLEKIFAINNNTIEYLTHKLNEYFANVPHNVTKSGQEKYKLPSGELVLMPAKLDYQRDDEKLLCWCKQNAPEYVKVKESVDWAGLKKAMTADGLIPEGVEPVEKPEEFKVRI